MPSGESSIVCKVCKLGKIIVDIETHYEYKPIPWHKHFFEKRSYLDRLVTRTFFEWLFQRRVVAKGTHTSSHLHCNVCGVLYKFLPKENLQPPRSTEGMYQDSPGVWISRESSSIFARDESR